MAPVGAFQGFDGLRDGDGIRWMGAVSVGHSRGWVRNSGWGRYPLDGGVGRGKAPELLIYLSIIM